MTNTVDLFNNFSIERYMEDGIDLDTIGNYMSVELFKELIPEDILPIIMESIRFRVNNVLSSALKDTLVEEYGISKLEFRRKPIDFTPITKEFTEFSDEQIINITDLKPFTKYFYYIEAYNKEYPIGIQISEVKNLLNKYPIVLPFKKDIYLNRISDIINNLGGSPDNIEEVLEEWVNKGNISHRETINILKEFGVDDIPRRKGLKFETLTKNFNTPIKSIKDEKKPIIVDADMIIEPLDIDFSEFIRENYDGIVNDLQTVSPLEIGQNIIYLGEIWGIPRGTTRKEIEKSNKLYELLGQNADKLISIIPSRDAVNKETSDRFMDEIISIISSQTTNPNLAEDLKIPAHVKLSVKYDERCVGTLSVSIDRKKDPLNALSQKEFSYTWGAEFGLMDYQYQGVEEGSDLFEGLDFNKSQFMVPDPQDPYKEILDWDAYIKAYRSAPAKFNIRAYINSDQIIYLNRKYPYSTKPVDIRGNEGSWTEREESGIQTKVTTESYVDVVNIIIICIILILILAYCIFSINQMKKKFMLKESLPIFLANMGIILIIVNLILSLALNIFPIKLEFFIIISLIFFILSKQMWAIRLTLGIAGFMLVLSLVSIFVHIFPELLITFRPPVDPNVPASFVSMIPTTLIVTIFMYIVSFAVSSNMLINNIGTKRNMVVGWIAIIVLFIASVVTSLIALNMYSAGQESELFRNIAIITGAGFIGTLIGVNVIGDWGKTIGQILFPLLIVGYGIFIIMGFVPIKLPLILILIAYLIIGTPWARSFTILYFFIQAFVLFFSFVILLFETEYQILLKLVLLIIGLIYVVMAIFTIKSKRVKDYSEGKL
jgi:hypothetical protein